MTVVFKDLQKLGSQSQQQEENTSKHILDLSIREDVKLTHTFCNNETKQIAVIASVDMQHIEKLSVKRMQQMSTKMQQQTE